MEVDLVFIRHGESLKNEAAHNYKVERNLPFCWSTFTKDPWFLQNVVYNPQFIDCGLSEKGIADCAEARKNLKGYEPDLILVSPLERALQTCSMIFPEQRIPRIVEPLISETFKHSSEICRSIPSKKERYPQFDFTHVEAEGEFWFIKNDSLENQKKYFDFLSKMETEYYHEKAKSISEFMHDNSIRESAKNVKERAAKVKEMLKEYRKKYSKICIVSHFYTIQCLTSKTFNAEDEPTDALIFQNGEVYGTTVADVCK